MATVSVQYKHLAPNPKSSYKQLFVNGTRLRARVLYGSYLSEVEPRTVEQIAADYKLPVHAVKEASEAALVDAVRSEGGNGSRHLAPVEMARIRREATVP